MEVDEAAKQGTKRCQPEDGNPDKPKRLVPEWAESKEAMYSHLENLPQWKRIEVRHFIKVRFMSFPLGSYDVDNLTAIINSRESKKNATFDATGKAVVMVRENNDASHTTFYTMNAKQFTEEGHDQIWDERYSSDAWELDRSEDLLNWEELHVDGALCRIMNPSFVYVFTIDS